MGPSRASGNLSLMSWFAFHSGSPLRPQKQATERPGPAEDWMRAADSRRVRSRWILTHALDLARALRACSRSRLPVYLRDRGRPVHSADRRRSVHDRPRARQRAGPRQHPPVSGRGPGDPVCHSRHPMVRSLADRVGGARGGARCQRGARVGPTIASQIGASESCSFLSSRPWL